MSHRFTTLRHPVEKLLEAEYFLGRLTCAHDLRFQFELNAFLSASRSVTFVLQKALSHVGSFEEWYGSKQAEMRKDAAMRFFLTLRNISQKEGPVSFVVGLLPSGEWTYRFVGRPEPVPNELAGRDIGACCATHLMKLANLLQECVGAFPFDSCPARALTEEGMAALGYNWRDVETALGLPTGWTDVATIPAAEKLRILSREIEPLDVSSIKRIAAGDLLADDVRLEFPPSNGANFVDALAVMLEGDDGSSDPRTAFVRATFRDPDDVKPS